MRQFIIEQSQHEFTSHAGLALIGQCLRKNIRLLKDLDRQFPMRHGIKNSEVLVSYLGLLCQGKNDYESIENFRKDRFFKKALGLRHVPSAATLRQRFDEYADVFQPVIAEVTVDFLIRSRAPITPLKTGHVPIDADVFTMDNSKTSKEGVSRTYQGYDGYAPMSITIGLEGWNIDIELRPGKTHCQRGTPETLRRVIKNAKRITGLPLLNRLDGGNDAAENMALCFQPDTLSDFLIKHNWRRTDPSYLYDEAVQLNQWEHPRPGKRVAVFSIIKPVTWEKKTYAVRMVIRVIERTINAKGECLLIPKLEIDGWWTTLTLPEKTVIALYQDHGTSEQYHSEFKTDLDVERLPSGKFATNALVLQMAALTYNILRWHGQAGLIGSNEPIRHPAQRRRIKTVIQELIYVAAMVVESGRRLKLLFSRDCPVYHIFKKLYEGFCEVSPVAA